MQTLKRFGGMEVQKIVKGAKSPSPNFKFIKLKNGRK